MPTRWARYVKHVSAHAPQHEIVARTGIGHTALSRWLAGQQPRPTADHAILFARAYKRPPGEALIAAGYLEPGECSDAAHITSWLTPVEELSNEELVAEIERYWREGGRRVIEMVSRFLGRPVEIDRPLQLTARKDRHPARRRTDPGQLHKFADVELLDVATELMDERARLMDEIGRRLLSRNGDSAN